MIASNRRGLVRLIDRYTIIYSIPQTIDPRQKSTALGGLEALHTNPKEFVPAYASFPDTYSGLFRDIVLMSMWKLR